MFLKLFTTICNAGLKLQNAIQKSSQQLMIRRQTQMIET
jgi:hypothetical protein